MKKGDIRNHSHTRIHPSLRCAWHTTAVLFLAASLPLRAQNGGPQGTPDFLQKWDIHFQSTLIGQGVAPFPEQYSGPYSLEAHGEAKETFSFDAYGRLHLWRNGKLMVDILAWQGDGLSGATGVAGFPNGEAFREGRTFPDAVISRAYLQETVPFGRRGSSPTTPSGSSARRLTFVLGHLVVTDFFDKNRYANDARTQFMNWALVNNVGWDYPANVIGSTNGTAAELRLPGWSFRAGLFQLTRWANAVRLDWNLLHVWSSVGEIERRQTFAGRSGDLRLLAYDEHAHMGSYQQALRAPQNIAALGQLGYRSKYGFGVNLQQDVSKNVGAFARLGWGDGRNQVWEYTDVDRTASGGISVNGKVWGRPGDTFGIAGVINGLSAVHREFLAAGGLGITVGDGRLDYGTERILEAYYSRPTRWHVVISPDFQFVVNPAYNRARGPAPIFALRFHWEK